MTYSHYILTLRCRDVAGISAAVSSTLAANGAFITESSQFGDADSSTFFMRTVFSAPGPVPGTMASLRAALAPVEKMFDMQLALHDKSRRMRVMLAVSRHGHCLNHLLHRWHSNELPVEVVGVISNHEDMRSLVEWYGLPYHFLPMQGDKPAQEQRLLDTFESSGAQLLVLARYMQVLSDDLCRRLDGRCINIHHSFLPSFKGAKPYHQAHDRGVKVVGATGHYVTADLDEGPIIEQDTVRVDHAMDAAEFVQLGKDVENVVLARAVQWHAEHRVLLSGHRTVVFR